MTKIGNAKKALIRQVEALEVFEDRYKHLRCVNVDVDEDEVRGSLSVVFKAYDTLEDRTVAIKFYDPDKLVSEYRLKAFKREPELLTKLIGKPRCATLIENLKHHSLLLKGADETTIPIPIPYFVLEWLEFDIDDYFERHNQYDAALKLSVFRSILLAVRSIHSVEIHHRDLKKDNLKRRDASESSDVVLIDFGTAAFINSVSIADSYEEPVGANAFAPPEAWSGLAGIRSINYLSDIFALGSLLFELFNYDLYMKICFENKSFEHVIWLLQNHVVGIENDDDKILAWCDLVSKFKKGLEPPTLLQEGNTVPISITSRLRSVHRDLCYFDFRDRESNFESILRRIDICMRILGSQIKEEQEQKRRNLFRQNRRKKIAAREQKLNDYLAKQSEISSLRVK